MTAAPHDPHIGLVVEGAGDAAALPALLRAHLMLAGEYRDVLGKPVACNGKPKALMPGGIEGKVAAAVSRPGCQGLLVVMDGDSDASCELGPQLAARSEKISRVPVKIVIAEPKFEAWLVASAETLGLPGLVYTEDRDPETAIKIALDPVKYVKPTWQPRLTHRVDVALAASRRGCLARMLARFDELRVRL